jgi:hypothetical protein
MIVSPRYGTMLIAATALAVLLCAGSAQAVALDDMLSISPPADITTSANMPCGGSYCAQVYFTFTASGGTPPYNFVCGAYPGSLFLVGSHNVGCLAQDSRGNSTPIKTFTITVTDYVHDVTPPVFQNAPGPISATADASGRALVSFTPLTAIDAHDGAVPVHCQPSSGGPDSFPVGVTTVTCTAEDSSANTATASFTITVTSAGTTGGTTTAPPTTPSAGTTPTAPAAPPPTATTTITTTVTQPATTTSAPSTPVEQSLHDQINALSAQIAALTDRVARLEKAGDAAWLAFEQAAAAGATNAEAADLARGIYLNAEYGLGAFAP